MATPSDHADVLKALRFGWAIAELRGRLRNGQPSDEPPPYRPEHTLPLEDERTWPEQTIEIETIVGALAADLKLDFKVDEITGQTGNDSAPSRVETLSKAITDARADGDQDTLKVKWNEACEFFYDWDAKIQDTLAAGSFFVASGYQLGRGLAEAFWAVDPEVSSDDPRSWASLLGGQRLVQLKRLLMRLADYFPPTTAETVTDSLDAWARVALDPDSRVRERDSTLSSLHKQIRIWHDALLLEQPPTFRMSASYLISSARSIGPVLKAFFPEAIVGILGFVAAGAAATFFAIGGVSHAVAPILTILGGFGITSAGALAKAKNEAHSLFTQVQLAMNTDLATRELTVPPAQTYLNRGRSPIKRTSRWWALWRLRRQDEPTALT